MAEEQDMTGHINGNDLDPEDIRNIMQAKRNQENIKRIADALRDRDEHIRAVEEKLNGLMASMSTLQQQMQQMKTELNMLRATSFTGGPTG